MRSLRGRGLPKPDDGTAKLPRIKVPMPRGIVVEDFANSLVIRRRWFHAMFLFLALFCVF